MPERTAERPVRFRLSYIIVGSGGSAGDHLTITVTKATPSTLHYQCSSHANMGGVVSVVGSEAPRVTENLTVTGHVLPGANDTYDLGATGNVWRDIYTGDLNLNNMAKQEGNAVDGTKGSWTIQEGAEDLFLLNKNTGKKYKFNLTEV